MRERGCREGQPRRPASRRQPSSGPSPRDSAPRPARRRRRRLRLLPAAPLPRTLATRSPALTREPLLTCSFATVPAAEDGTSIVAFSVSSVTSGDSSATASPSFTSTSITSTSLKSPRSGTRTSSVRSGACCSRGRRRLRGRRRRGLHGRCAAGRGRDRGRGFNHDNRRTLRDAIAFLDRHLGDAPGRRRRHVHGRLVGLERDERRFERDGVSRLDEHLDDFDVVKVADVRHEDRGAGSHGRSAHHGIGLVGIDAELLHGERDARAVDAAVVGKRLERRDHDPVAVHFEVPAQRRLESLRPNPSVPSATYRPGTHWRIWSATVFM